MMKTKLKFVGVILLVLAITGLLTYLYNVMNVSLTRYHQAHSNMVTIKELDANSLYHITGVQSHNEKTSLHIENQSNKTVDIVLNYLAYNHQIYLNGKLISQNKDPHKPHYDKRFSFKRFQLHESSTLFIEGPRARSTTYFYAETKAMDMYLQMRGFFYSLYIVCLILIGGFNLVLYLFNRHKYHFLLMTLMSLLIIVKVYLKGDLYFLLELFSPSIYVRNQLHAYIGILWILVPLLAIGRFYEFTHKKIYRILVGSTFTIMFLIHLIGDYSFNHNLIIIATVPLYLYVISSVIATQGKKWRWLMVTNMTMASSGLYKGLISTGFFKTGVIEFVTYISATALVIFMAILLFMFAHSHFAEIKKLRNKELKYERLKLLRGLGHDLKMPISVIKSSNQIISKYDMPKEDRNDYLSTGLEAVNELELMVKNISSYIDGSMKQKTKNNTTSIRDNFHQISRQLDIYQTNKNYTFDILLDDQDAMIPLGYSEFYRLIFNLVNNAFKYTEEGGSITLSYKVDQQVRIIVRDTGIGMTEKEVQNIFEPFYRADDARSVDGLGLGLSVVKNIMDNINGGISVDSQVNKGTIITLIIDECA